MPDWALVSLQSMSPPGGKDIRRPGGDLPTWEATRSWSDTSKRSARKGHSQCSVVTGLAEARRNQVLARLGMVTTNKGEGGHTSWRTDFSFHVAPLPRQFIR